LRNYADGPELTANSGHKNLALLPFPNRLLEGAYNWNGEALKFSVNKPDTNSALHGFGPDAPFQVAQYELDSSFARVVLSYLHQPAQHTVSYPFLLEFQIHLTVDLRDQAMSWNLTAKNLGDTSAPVGLGWHPYFVLPGGAEVWLLEMPANEHVVLAKAIPTGEREAGLAPKQASKLDTSWDDCFALSDLNDRQVRLLGPEYSLTLKQTAATRYTQLYMPPDAASIAIEPMSCGVNAFRDAENEVTLQPSETIATGMHLSIQL
jgi:aldose 1-epimerase